MREISVFERHVWNEAGRFQISFCFWISFLWVKNKWSAVYFQYIMIAPKFAYNKNKLYKAWFWVFGIGFRNSFSTTSWVWLFKKNVCHVTFFLFLIYLAICVLQLFFPSMLKITLSFLASHFSTWLKSQEKN